MRKSTGLATLYTGRVKHEMRSNRKSSVCRIQLLHTLLKGRNHGASDLLFDLGEHLIVDGIPKPHADVELDGGLRFVCFEPFDFPACLQNLEETLASVVAAPGFDGALRRIAGYNTVPGFFESELLVPYP